MSATAVLALTYREKLVFLFAGEEYEGYQITAPYYRLHLAIELCRAITPETVMELREAVYGKDTPVSAIPVEALQMLAAGWHQWRVQTRRLNG